MGRTLQAVIAFAVLLPSARVQAETDDERHEARVKASFLFNFARFVEWPDEAFAGGRFHVCAVGDQTLTVQLGLAFHGKTLQGRGVEVRGREPAAGWRECHVLYVSHRASKRIAEILARVKGAPVLTVSEAPEFLDRGGLVLLSVDGAKVRHEVNRDSVLRSQLRLSSQLLRLSAVR